MAVPLSGSTGATEVYSQRLDRLNEKFAWLQQQLRTAGANGAGNGLVSRILFYFYFYDYKLCVYVMCFKKFGEIQMGSLFCY